jgi:hypothetical protein
MTTVNRHYEPGTDVTSQQQHWSPIYGQCLPEVAMLMPRWGRSLAGDNQVRRPTAGLSFHSSYYIVSDRDAEFHVVITQ